MWRWLVPWPTADLDVDDISPEQPCNCWRPCTLRYAHCPLVAAGRLYRHCERYPLAQYLSEFVRKFLLCHVNRFLFRLQLAPRTLREIGLELTSYVAAGATYTYFDPRRYVIRSGGIMGAERCDIADVLSPNCAMRTGIRGCKVATGLAFYTT